MHHLYKLKRFLRPYINKSIAALVLLTSVVVMDLSIPWLIRVLIDKGISQQNQTVVIHTALLMLGMTILNTLFSIGNNYLSVQVGEGIGRDLRQALFLKIQQLSNGNIDQLKTGQLVVRLTSDVNAFKNLMQISLRIGTRAPFLLVGSLILMYSTESHLAMMMLPILVVLSIIITVFIFKAEPFFRAVQTKLDALNTVLQENISGVRVVKAFVRARHEAQRFDKANTEFTDKSTSVMRLMAALMPLLILLINAGMVAVVWAGGTRVIQGEMTVGQIVAFTNYLLTTMIPLIMMTMLSTVWAGGIASAKRVNEVFDAIPEVLDAGDACTLPDKIAGKIEFRDVSFYYQGNVGENVLDHINLVVDAGSTVAFLGSTGAGKSTLMHLVSRDYDVTAGAIYLDGIDVRKIKQRSLHSHIGIVPQESLLFSGTVRENLCYGKPDATDDEVIAAAKAAQAEEFINELPEGYNAHVEQRGNNFSGGQKQRISIARALLPAPAILILDDSTSAVDVETEIKIQDALEQLPGSHTVLVVAQRISTVLNADKIVVIDKGRVVAEGTHRELLAGSPIYQEIYNSQLGDGYTIDTVLSDGKEGQNNG